MPPQIFNDNRYLGVGILLLTIFKAFLQEAEVFIKKKLLVYKISFRLFLPQAHFLTPLNSLQCKENLLKVNVGLFGIEMGKFWPVAQLCVYIAF